jgi:hypothetical protein
VAAFQFLDLIYRRQGSLNGGSARRSPLEPIKLHALRQRRYLFDTLFFIQVFMTAALCWAVAAFQFPDLIHRRQVSLNGGSARRKGSA